MKKKNLNQTELYAEEYRNLGINIAYYRKIRGYTQMELAEMAAISRTFMGNIEATGKTTPISMNTLFTLAKCLDIAPYLLLKPPIDER